MTTAPNLVVAGDRGLSQKLRNTGRFLAVFDVASATELQELSRSGRVRPPAAFVFAPDFDEDVSGGGVAHLANGLTAYGFTVLVHGFFTERGDVFDPGVVAATAPMNVSDLLAVLSAAEPVSLAEPDLQFEPPPEPWAPPEVLPVQDAFGIAVSAGTAPTAGAFTDTPEEAPRETPAPPAVAFGEAPQDLAAPPVEAHAEGPGEVSAAPPVEAFAEAPQDVAGPPVEAFMEGPQAAYAPPVEAFAEGPQDVSAPLGEPFVESPRDASAPPTYWEGMTGWAWEDTGPEPGDTLGPQEAAYAAAPATPRRGGRPKILLAALAVFVVGVVGIGVVGLLTAGGADERSPRAEPPPRAPSPTQTSGTRSPQAGPTGVPTSAPTPVRPVKKYVPGQVRIVDGQVSIEVSWADRSGGRASYYVVGGPTGRPPSTLASAPPGAAKVMVNALNPSVDYCLTVVAVVDVDQVAHAKPVCTHRVKRGG